MENDIDLLVEMKYSHILKKDIAEKQGVSASLVCRDFRTGLTEVKRRLYWRIVQEIKQERELIAL